MTYLQKKKLAFMRIVNGIKGFVRTVTGTPPITLPDCVDNDSLINYSIMGNCVQDGTPTLDNPVEVKCVGEYDEKSGKYKIPIVASGKNLFNVDEFVAKMQSLGVGSKQIIDGVNAYTYNIGQTHGGNFSNAFTGEEGKRYRFSMRIKALPTSATEGAIYYGFAYTDGTTSYNSTDFIKAKDGFIRVGATSQSGKTVKSIALSYGSIANYAIDLDSMQIEEGTTQTDYEPYVESIRTTLYLDEPIRKVGDFTDYIDFENQCVVRKVGSTEFDETLTYYDYALASSNFYGFYTYVNDMRKADRQAGLCTYLHKNTNTIWFGVNTTSTQVFFSIPEIYNAGTDRETRRTALKEWLSSLEMPFMVYYPLAEEKHIPIELPKLPTFKGTTIYTVETETQPTNMSATYYSTRKGE